MGDEETHIFQSIVPVPPFDKLLESDQVIQLLLRELSFIEKMISGHPREQRLRRIYIRSLFAFIEGTVYRLKQDAMAFKEFPHSELPILKEIIPRLNNKGKVEETEMHLRLMDNLRYAFCAIGEAFGIVYTLDSSDNGWSSIKKSLAIRHRITHPKNFSDLVISDQEWTCIVEAKEWFVGQIKHLFGNMANKVQEETRQK